MSQEPTVLAVALSPAPTWLVGEDDGMTVRVIESGYMNDGIYITAPLRFNGALESGHWVEGVSGEHPLPQFQGALRGGNWHRDGAGVYHADLPPGAQPEEVGEPDICQCGRVGGPPYRWALPAVCDRCTNYGAF
jgi:hypothetical protein